MNKRHFIVATSGTAGDTFPFLSIARELQKHGHTVTFAAPSAHRKYAQKANVSFYGFGSDEQYYEALNEPDLWSIRKGIATVWKYTQESLTLFPDYIKGLPKDEALVIIAHPLLLPATALARAERPDIKIIAIYLAPANLRTCCDPLTIGPLKIASWIPKIFRNWLWRMIDAWFIDPAILPSLNKIHKEKGLGTISHFVDHMQSIADISIALFPAWFAKSQPDWPSPIRNTHFQLYDPNDEEALASDLIEFLNNGDAPVIFTPGTGNRHAAKYFEYAAKACQRLKHRAIFLTLFPEQLPKNLPDSILCQSYVPLGKLLPYAAAIVHHGGIGTTAEALRAGTPQLVVPMAHDQFDNAARIEALRVGLSLYSSRLNARSLYKKLNEILNSKSIHVQSKKISAYFSDLNNIESFHNFL